MKNDGPNGAKLGDHTQAPTTETRAAHERASRTLRELCASGMLANQRVIEEMKRDGTWGFV